MPPRGDRSLASLLLTQRLVDTPAAPLASAEYWPLAEQVGGDLAALLGQDATTITATHGVAPALAARVARLLDAATAFAIALQDAQSRGLRLLAAGDTDYPRRLADRLGHRAPPILYAYGDTALLVGGLLGVVGSRDVTADGAEVATRAGQTAVAAGLGVVSGCARGTDTCAMTGALEAGGRVVGIPAASLTQTTARDRWRRAIWDGHACLVSPYGPDTGFSAARAHGRNPLVYALSQATVVVASRVGRGGTWHGATGALTRQLAPVAAWTGPGGGPGNPRLVATGATAVGSLDDLTRLLATT